MADKRKLPLLLTVLASAAALVAWDRWPANGQGPLVIGAVERTRAAPGHTSARTESTIGVSSIPPGTTEVPALLPRDMFANDAARNNPFEPPARPAPPITAAAPTLVEHPTAPALPFTLFGRKYEEGRWEVYLAKGDQTYIVHADDVIEDTYKVLEVKPPTMTLLYLPTNERQTMQIGAPTND